HTRLLLHQLPHPEQAAPGGHAGRFGGHPGIFQYHRGRVGPMTAQTKTLRELSPERMRQFHDYAEEYPNKRSALMMVLRLAEEEFGSITDEAMEIVAGLCNVKVSHVQGMVTFYTHFKRPFHGKHRFMVCATLMCADRKSVV